MQFMPKSKPNTLQLQYGFCCLPSLSTSTERLGRVFNHFSFNTNTMKIHGFALFYYPFIHTSYVLDSDVYNQILPEQIFIWLRVGKWYCTLTLESTQPTEIKYYTKFPCFLFFLIIHCIIDSTWYVSYLPYVNKTNWRFGCQCDRYFVCVFQFFFQIPINYLSLTY